jgi:hypothetical protein
MSGVLVSQLPDDDVQAAPAVLGRAGVQARELARKTGTATLRGLYAASEQCRRRSRGRLRDLPPAKGRSVRFLPVS